MGDRARAHADGLGVLGDVLVSGEPVASRRWSVPVPSQISHDAIVGDGRVISHDVEGQRMGAMTVRPGEWDSQAGRDARTVGYV